MTSRITTKDDLKKERFINQALLARKEKFSRELLDLKAQVKAIKVERNLLLDELMRRSDKPTNEHPGKETGTVFEDEDELVE
ncbi:hypothetical protein HDU91_007511 [Kappamyces sp. JEL0680]|nr:hypothetical protein HDU91_007511 [Kappamyces sp. JEL0680]